MDYSPVILRLCVPCPMLMPHAIKIGGVGLGTETGGINVRYPTGSESMDSLRDGSASPRQSRTKRREGQNERPISVRFEEGSR